MGEKLFLIIALVGLNFIGACNSKEPVTQHPLIIDHDGGIDDAIATTLHLLNTPEHVKAITIAPADCYGKPATWVTIQIKKLFVSPDLTIPVGISNDEGTNPFPTMWREDAWRQARMPFWHDEEALTNFSLNDVPSALTVLTQALQESSVPVDILETGPCTNLAELLRIHPELKNKIHRIFIMGGALYVKGNVEQPGHDGSAEWNIYNNPQAFKDVLRSGIAITLVPLDATQYTPITQKFIGQLKQHLTIPACRLVYDSLQVIKPFIESGEYLFWDTLTSAVIINPAIVKTKKITINVNIDGPSMGRTFEDKDGFEVDAALWADHELFEKTVLDVLGAK